MAWYRRYKFARNVFDKFLSQIVTKAPVHQPASKNFLGSGFEQSLFSNGDNRKVLQLRTGTFSWTNKNPYNPPFIGTISRFYHGDNRKFLHFGTRAFSWIKKNPKIAYAIVVVGSGVVVTIYYGHAETIPYTNRTHFLILSKEYERALGEQEFKEMKASYKGRMLVRKHPDNIKVQLIAKKIIEALQKGSEKGGNCATKHLEGLKWEVIVVNDPTVNAYCLPGGKIVVFTGLLKRFQTNTEIATILGHEVAHAVARHTAEQITKNMWLFIVQLILYGFFNPDPDLVQKLSNWMFSLPFSRRLEFEADYIGLLLMASAGYDPRVAPGVFKKLSEVSGEETESTRWARFVTYISTFFSTHPSGEKRAETLARAKVMEEALALFHKSMDRKQVDSFLG